MDKLTARQEEYLLFLVANDGQSHQLSNLSAYFDVSKGSASQVMQCLIERGMIKKHEKTLCITPAGHSYISPKLEQWKWISLWFTSQFGMEPLMADHDACTMVCNLSQDAVKFIVETCKKAVELPESNEFDKVVSEKRIHFSIYKKGTDILSMGDKGFVKPATIVKDEHGEWLMLETKHIKYSKSKNSPLEGALHRLWYAKDMIWVEAAMFKPGVYRIPLESLNIYPEGKRATLRIRARATVGIFSMPESEALLTLDCSNLKLT